MLVILSFDKPSLIDGESDNNLKITFLDQVVCSGSPAAILPADVKHGFHAAKRKRQSEGYCIFIEILTAQVEVGAAIGES